MKHIPASSVPDDIKNLASQFPHIFSNLMSGFLGGRTGLVQVIDLAGEGGHGVEVRPVQAVDLLLRGGRHRPPSLQHHSHPKVPLLHLPVRTCCFFSVENNFSLKREQRSNICGDEKLQKNVYSQV